MRQNSNKKDTTLLNEEITFSEVRCVGDDGSQYGILSSNDALGIAQEMGLDLVLIAENANPPVVKVMDYGKFKYQQEKKKKEAKKKQKTIVVKEIKLSVKIADNDIGYKVKHAREFIEVGHHVKFRVFLKGREMANPEVAKDVLDRVWHMMEDISVIDKAPQLEGRYYNMMVIPQKDK